MDQAWSSRRLRQRARRSRPVFRTQSQPLGWHGSVAGLAPEEAGGAAETAKQALKPAPGLPPFPAEPAPDLQAACPATRPVGSDGQFGLADLEQMAIVEKITKPNPGAGVQIQSIW